MKTVLAIFAFAALIGISIPAFADEIPFPVLPTDNWTGTDVKTFYPTNSSYIVQISVHYTVQSPLDVTNTITWIDLEGQTHTIELQEEFTLEHFPTEEEPVITPDTGLTADDVEKILDDKKDELEIAEENTYSKLRQCIAEFEQEQPIRFEAWKRTAALQEFEIPNQVINADTYDRIQLKAMKQWVICEMIKKYEFIGVYEANKIQDIHDTQSLDDTDDPRTVDITAEHIKAEEERAQEYSCSNIGHQKGLCVREFTGINRGNPDGYSLPQWYGEWKEMNAVETDTTGAINRALVAQCDNYYHLYEHKIETDRFPNWLEHCVQ